MKINEEAIVPYDVDNQTAAANVMPDENNAPPQAQPQPQPQENRANNGGYLPYLPELPEIQLARNLRTARRVFSNAVISFFTPPGVRSSSWRNDPITELRKTGERAIFTQLLTYIQDEKTQTQIMNIFINLQYNGLDREMPFQLADETYQPIVSKLFNASLLASTRKISYVMGEAMNVAIIAYLTSNLVSNEEAGILEYTLSIALYLIYRLIFCNLLFTSPLKSFIEDQTEKKLQEAINALEKTEVFQQCVYRSLESKGIQKTLQAMIDVFLASTAETQIDCISSVLDDANTEWLISGDMKDKTESEIRYAYFQALYREAYAKRVANELDATLNSKVFVNVRPFGAETDRALVFNTIMQVTRSVLSKQVKEYILTNGYTEISAELKIQNARDLAEKKNFSLVRYNKPKEILEMSASIVCRYRRVEHELLSGIASFPYKDLARAGIEYIGQNTLPMLFGRPRPPVAPFEIMHNHFLPVQPPQEQVIELPQQENNVQEDINPVVQRPNVNL